VYLLIKRSLVRAIVAILQRTYDTDHRSGGTLVSMSATLGVIGAGNMGGAIIRGAVASKVLEPAAMLVAEPDALRRESFVALGCRVTEDIAEVVRCEQIMLAVKPQMFPSVAAQLQPLPQRTIVISIMAGLESNAIRTALGEHACVIRVMPNTPCQVGAGMTGIALGAGAESGDESLAQRLFESIGVCLRVDEQHMHAVTAVSGSGPAYVYLLAEAMQQAADQLGLSHHDARIFAQQTVIGAARLLESSEKSASELRQAVTSPGGTTAAALEVMFERELPQIIAEAMLAARDRGEELSRL
jgi:pyrroline-5-carboxylate reductase